MKSVDCHINSKISWSCETNWVIAHGSLKDSVTVESSDDPIDESDPDNTGRKSLLILKPRASDSGPCEIKISFEQKYEVCQIYVRSTARTYEIYYTCSPHSINEYLSTVRCGIAERDDKVLHTNCIENVAEEHREGPSGEVTADAAADGGSIVTGEDDWINIKAPEVGKSSASDKLSTNGVNNIQDFYEATAQISDSDPCLSLTIRLLSLQDKRHLYVDEIYVFVDPVESTDSGNEALMAGSSTQSSLMAMFMPTLLQLSKSGVNRVQDKCASDEVLKDGKMETGPTITDKIDSRKQRIDLLQLSKSGVNRVQDKCASDEVLKDGKMETGPRITDKIDSWKPRIDPKEMDEDTAGSSELKDTAVSSELEQHTPANKFVEPKDLNDSLPVHLEIAFEQLISRLSRVEDICLRFEEKMLKPIESMEARLQQVENQLEKLVKNSQNFGLPHFTKISAPEFSCSESNSSSLYNDQSDYPPHGASDLEKKDFSCNNTPKLAPDANFHPSLVVSAPEFSCCEGEEDNDLKPLKDSPRVKQNKTLSLDDALAASLKGFLSTAAINPSENIQATSGFSSQINEEKQHHKHAESWEIKTEEFRAADNGNGESSQYAQVLTIKAPDFTAEETGDEEHLNCTRTSLDVASVTENEKRDDCNEMVPPSIQSNSLFTCTDSFDFVKGESTDDFGSAPNGDSPAVSVKVSGRCLDNGHLNGCSEVKVIDSYFEGDTCSGPGMISNGSAPDPADDPVETGRHQILDETNPVGRSITSNKDDQSNASEHVSVHESENVSEVLEHVAVTRSLKYNAPNVSEYSHASLLDFQFPILEVKFTSDAHMSTKSPLEALLGEAAESNTEAPSANATGNDDGHVEQINAAITSGNETTDLLPTKYPLVDLGVSAADGSSNLEGISPDQCTPSSLEMNASLI